jgi:hypothetical protein
MRTTLRIATFTALIAGVLFAANAHAGGDWNDKQISWQAYDTGLAAAAKEKKPVCLVFYTEWCPHCTNYSKVFHDPKVVEESKKFVMIRLDKDKNEAISKQYAPDGEYIPRTYFLTPDGKLTDVTAPRPQYKYFYDERNASSLLGGMQAALAKAKS